MKARASDKPTPKNKEDLIEFVEDLKRQWMSTIDSLVDPLMIVREDYTISKANLAMAKWAGKDIKNIINEKCHKVFANRNKPCSGCKMMNAAKSGDAKPFDLDGVNDRFFEVTSQPIYDSDKKLTGVVQVYRDRTDRKKMEEQLLQSEKLASIGLLAGGVAHEINNPLGGILVFSEMLLRELPKDSAHRLDVEEILSATKRCKAIVENLLDFARTRPASKKKNEKLPDTNITEAAKTALRFGRVSVAPHLVEIAENWREEEIVIKADRNKLIQVFLNLYQNAFQAMPDGGTLSLACYIEKNGPNKNAIFTIRDTGVGIAEEHLSAVFDPFFTTKEPGEGTGLGLAICYGIVQDLGGDIKIESVINKGTTFKVIFPMKKAALKAS